MKKKENVKKRKKLTEPNYRVYEEKLNSSTTSVAELGQICMTLAHDPSKNAQNLLAMFKKSKNAHKVEWLDLAIEEGQFGYLEPQNQQEERNYLALKVMQETWDQLVDLNIKLKDEQLVIDKLKIEHDAIRELVKKGEINPDKALGLEDVELTFESKVDDLRQEINLMDKIFDQIKESIKTVRYKDVDPLEMRNIHFS